MKSIPAALSAWLAANSEGVGADLITLTLAGGGVYRWTSADLDIVTSDARTFSHLGQLIEVGHTRQQNDLTVDSFEFTVQLAGVPTLIQQAVNGLLDGGSVKRELAIMPAWGNTSLGLPVLMWSGYVSQVEPTSTEILFRCKNDLERLNVQIPRRLFQPQCPYQLGDTGCGVSLAGYTLSATALANSTASMVNSSVAVTSAKVLGWLTFTSGQNAGMSRMVKSVGSPSLYMNVPFPYAPAVGDAFTVTDGCDKTINGGCTHFANTARYGGFIYIPQVEAVGTSGSGS